MLEEYPWEAAIEMFMKYLVAALFVFVAKVMAARRRCGSQGDRVKSTSPSFPEEGRHPVGPAGLPGQPRHRGPRG